MFGGFQFGEEPFGGATVAVAVREPLDLSTGYFLEVRTSGGSLLAAMTRDVTSATWSEELGRPDVLKMSVPLSSGAAPYLQRPNQVWLYDSAKTLVQRFEVQRRTDKGIQGESVSVEAYSLMALMDRARVRNYVSGVETVRNIVKAYLAFQDATSPRVTLGHIDSAIGSLTRSVAWDQDTPTVLEAVQRLQELVGGYLWVSKDGKLIWKTARGRRQGQRLTRRRNATGITIETDEGNLANRIYGYGKDGLILDSGDYPGGYIEDSGSIATYGVVEAVFEDNRITSTATLEAAVLKQLASRAEPVYSVQVDGANLGAWRGNDEPWAEFGLGDVVRVIDENVLDLAGDPLAIEVEVVAKTTDLLAPLQLNVELANLSPKWERLLADLLGEAGEDTTALSDVVEASLDFDGVGDPGTSPLALRSDASIPLDLDALGTALGLDELTPPLPGDSEPSPISSDAADAGVLDAYARADHTHFGVEFYSVTDKADLPTGVNEGAEARTTGTYKRKYTYINGDWICTTHLESV